MVRLLLLIYLALTYLDPIPSVIENGSIDPSTKVFFYNCENLFDTINDPSYGDDEFLPRGPRGWNGYKYRKKLEAIFKVIAASGGWKPPDVIGLCEVENHNVLSDLIRRTNLARFNYEIVHFESSDHRGIDCALLFNKDVFRLIEKASFDPRLSLPDSLRTRSLLFARLGNYTDTIDFFVCHWPSNRGGIAESAPVREKIAIFQKGIIDSIISKYGEESKILVMGDFNCEKGDREMEIMFEPIADSKIRLVLLSGKGRGSVEGTYKYQGKWYCYDNILVNSSMLSKGTVGDLQILDHSFLMEKDIDFPGLRPFSTFRGYVYNGGYSDHLPLIVDIKFSQD